MTSYLSRGKLRPDADFVTVIMAGGSGTRFWPVSRTKLPKQYLALGPDNRSLLRATVDRVSALPGKQSVLVVTGESQLALVEEHAPEAAILCEPVARNTAPALGLAALTVLKEVGDVPMICIPADHLIHNDAGLQAAYAAGVELTRKHDIVATIGIPPTFPETGFGYIRRGGKFIGSAEVPVETYQVDAFVEKPSRERAEEYLLSGQYYWNAGMFLWRPSVLLEEINQHAPELALALNSIKDANELNQPDKVAEIFRQISPISIDFAVMERAANGVVIPGFGFHWSDVGSWHAWAESLELPPDRVSSGIPGSDLSAGRSALHGDTFSLDCKNTALWSSGRFVAAIGLEDAIVVETPEAVLVCHRERSQDVRAVIEYLRKQKREDLL